MTGRWIGVTWALVIALAGCDGSSAGSAEGDAVVSDAMGAGIDMGTDGMASDMAGMASDMASLVDMASDGMLDAMVGDAQPEPQEGRCEAVPLFEAAPERRIHVSPDGDDATGDGSFGAPYGTLRHAVGLATPGTEVRLLAGVYPGGVTLEGVRGTAEAPIVIGGAPLGRNNRPVIDGAGHSEGLHLVRPRWVVLRELIVRGARDNGINVDDGGDYDDPEAARWVRFDALTIEDIGPAGNRDCLKLSGLDDFEVTGSVFRRCGDGGSGVDLVGCHDGVIHESRFEELGSSGVQAKGGTARVRVAHNRFVDAGARPVNMGGSTGFEFFRPPLDAAGPNAEARQIEVVSNVFVGGQTAAAFVGCVDCVFAHNTVVEPETWLLRILQETTSREGFAFEPARDGWVTGNIFVFRRAGVRTAVNVGPDTEVGSFRFTHNLFYAVDAPDQSDPMLPGVGVGSIVGADPGLDAEYLPEDGGPAVGAGDPAVETLLRAGCYGGPPTLGAFELAERLWPSP